MSARITPTSSQRSTPAANHGTPHLRAPLLASTSMLGTAKHSPSCLTRTATPVTDTTAKQVAVTLAHGVSPVSNGASDRRYSSQQAHMTSMTSFRTTPTGDDDAAAVTTADSADAATAYVDRVEKVDSAVAAGGATETPTTNELQSHSFREVPLGEASILGVLHILIPVSTMELLFRRFDMLQEQLDELKSLMSKNPDSRSIHPLL